MAHKKDIDIELDEFINKLKIKHNLKQSQVIYILADALERNIKKYEIKKESGLIRIVVNGKNIYEK
jgi:hypothetical protein